MRRKETETLAGEGSIMSLVTMMTTIEQLWEVQFFYRVESHFIYLSGGPRGWVGTDLTGGNLFRS
jgi:hypothetical protein